MSLWRGQLLHVAQDVGIPSHVRAAVEVEHLTGQPRCLGQEHHGVGDVLGSAGAAQRCVLHVFVDDARNRLTDPPAAKIVAPPRSASYSCSDALTRFARSLRSPIMTSFSSRASSSTERPAASRVTPSTMVCLSSGVTSGFPRVFIIAASGSMSCSMKWSMPPAPPPKCHCRLWPITPHRSPGP